jgi:hypothetical protein
MSETHHFDPYTGDPIPEESVNPPAPDIHSNPDFNAAQENPAGQPAPERPYQGYQPQDGTSQDAASSYQSASQGTSTSYQNPTANDTYRGYQPASDNAQDFRYNPYTGQPVDTSAAPEDAERKSNTFGTIALITGICTIVFSFCSLFCCPFLSIITGIVAIIFGVLAKNPNGERKGPAVAGIITGIIGLVLVLLISVFLIVRMSSGDFQKEFYKQFNGLMDDANGTGNSLDDDKYNYNSDYNNYDGDLYHSDDFYVR